MTFSTYKKEFTARLAPYYDLMEAESFFYLILEQLHQLRRIDLALSPQLEIDQKMRLRWEEILSELEKHRPIQYILGETTFGGRRFRVNPSVLIPRPETEELVELICQNQKNQGEGLRILDIGTGSGCIAVSLALNLPNAQVAALDVSEKALATAKENAALNAAQVKLVRQDILQADDLGQEFEIIVSNPPYVRELEKEEIKANVLQYEPHLALFVEDNDPLLFYRKIAQLAHKNLTGDGQLYFEINQYLGTQTVALLENMGFREVMLQQDLYGNDRMVWCRK